MKSQKIYGLGATALLSLALSVPAAHAQGRPVMTFPTRQIPQGAAVQVKLLRALSSESATLGDPVRAEVTGDGSGLPDGTVLTGVVTVARPATPKRPGVVDVQFGGADGQGSEIASAHLTGTAAKSDKSQDVGIGAGVGGLLGLSRKRKLGDALTGAALGALGGYAVNAAQKHPANDLNLKSGSVITLHLDRTLTLRTELDAY